MGKSNKFSLTTKSHSTTRVNPYDKITLNALNVSCPDKQIVLPKLGSNGVQQVFIELYSLFIFIVALGTQYLNLYRSVWWLSKTRSSQTINYHLIDLDVSQFSLIFIGQSSLISILRALLNKATISTTTNSSSSTLSILAQHQQTPPTQNSNSASSSNNTTNTNSSSDLKHHHNQNHNHQQQQTSSHQINGSNNHSNHNNQNQNPPFTITTVVTATVSWICNYYLFKCAYRVWNNFGLNGVSCISYPIVSFFCSTTPHTLNSLKLTPFSPFYPS